MALAVHYTQVPRLDAILAIERKTEEQADLADCTPATSSSGAKIARGPLTTSDSGATSTSAAASQSSTSPGRGTDDYFIYPDANGNCPEGLIIFERPDGTKVCVYGVVPGIGEQREGDTVTSLGPTSTPVSSTPSQGVANPDPRPDPGNPDTSSSQPSSGSQGQPQPFVQPQQPDTARSQTGQQQQNPQSTQVQEQGGPQPTQGAQGSDVASQVGGSGGGDRASQTVQQGSDPTTSPTPSQAGTQAGAQAAASATTLGAGATAAGGGSGTTSPSTTTLQTSIGSATADVAAASTSGQVGTLDGVTGTRRIAPVAQSSGSASRLMGTGAEGSKARLLSLGVVGVCLALGLVAVV